jgi:peptidoglycan/LPS O-acetylase OafA/YrhL
VRADERLTPAAPPPAPSHRSSRYPALDGIRGIAVLSVMTFHFFLFGKMASTDVVDRVAAGTAKAGWAGVDLFFVLSGFLITGILFDARGKPHFLRNFYARRVLRIFPLYYGVLVAFFVVLPHLFASSSVVRANTGGQAWFWSYLSNVHVALHGWSATSVYVDHFWSLSIEEQFYVLWPFVVAALSRRALLRTCAAIAVASLLLRIWLHAHHLPNAAFVLTATRMDALAIGAFISLGVRGADELRTMLRWVKPMLATTTALLAAIWIARGGFDKNDPVVGTIGFTLLAISFGGVILLAIYPAGGGSRMTRLFLCKPLRALGKYSYSLYVFHQPVALLLVSVGISAAAAPAVWGSALPGELAYAAIAGTISLIAAMLSWHLFEKHFLKLKDRFPEATGALLRAPLRASWSLGNRGGGANAVGSYAQSLESMGLGGEVAREDPEARM